MWEGEERRQFYRVDDRVAMRYQRLRDEQAVSDETARLSVRNRLVALDQDLDHQLSVLADESPRIHRAMRLLNEKLTLLLGAELAHAEDDESGLQLQSVNLSAGGLAFDVDEWIKVGERLLVELIFYPEGEAFSAIVRVITSDSVSGGYRLGTDFDGLPESDRERLIRHILSIQSQQLRQRRQQREGDEPSG
ncbi:MAG: PilZ domain-containing protein [Marinobacter sp.]|nr:PilZ domain-containing protein [Marinobacter sp.]